MLKVLWVVVAVSSGLFAFGNALAEQNRQEIMRLQQIVMDQNERLDGLSSLVEGMSATLAKLEQHQSISSKDPRYDEMKRLITDLGTMIDKINANYLSKQEFKRYVEGGGSVVSAAKKPVKSQAVPKSIPVKKPQPEKTLSSAERYSQGVRYFVKKRYDEAKKDFVLTAKAGYKPAASNYYLGEIAYYTKHYKEAVYYYKKSAGLYDKAGYMDVLLLHTAISLDKLGQKAQAKQFYESVIAGYPNGKAAAIARKRVQ